MQLHWARAALCGLVLPFFASAQGQDAYTPNQRILTIRNLGKRDSTVIPTLAQYLKDPNPDIRVEAVKAIVRIDTMHSLDPLIEAIHDNDAEIQIRATDGLVNAYLPGYVKSGLGGMLNHSVKQVKSFFSNRNDQVIGQDVVIRPDVADALGIEITGGASVDARANAARAAGILRARPAVPALDQAAHSKETQLIFECLVALQKIHDPSAGPTIAFLTHDLEDRIQITALETIGLLRSLDAAPDVRIALTNARNAKVRRAALSALAMLAIPGDRSIFQQYVHNSDADLKIAALEGLARIREPEDYPELEAAYNEQGADTRVHLAAAFALVDEGKLELTEFSPLQYLVDNLDNKRYGDIARAYVSELARRDDVRASLAKVVPQATKDQKIALCSALADSHAEDAIPILTNLSRDIDPDVAFAASRALRILQSHGT